jgi:hypothetical protein
MSSLKTEKSVCVVFDIVAQKFEIPQLYRNTGWFFVEVLVWNAKLRDWICVGMF